MCLCVKCASAPLLTSILVPNREHPEYEGAERGGKISPPVIPHRKVGRRDLNTEQHPWWWWRERQQERERNKEREEERGRGREEEEGQRGRGGIKVKKKMRMDSVRKERRGG